jgi:NAD-dependent deacetylase
MSDSDPKRLAELVDAAARVAVFTGAGMSTESGIPDFRSPGGIWSRMQPIQYADFLNSKESRHEAWRRVFSGERDLVGKRPNSGHDVIARWTRAGKVSAVITQNVDNLHQLSGVPEARIIELHGNAGYATCLNCGARTELPDLEPEFRQEGEIGPCSRCGGTVKLATISFGQPMPEAAMDRAASETEACDLFLAIGSSLQVYPAAGFPEMAKRAGAKLAIVNREATPLDGLADLAVQGEIGATLEAADTA